jgi:hypothetical protein
VGVEACDDCGGQVADSAETCPHCGSNANHLRRIRPLQEEEAKNEQQKKEEAQKKTQRGCLITAVAIFALVGGCVAFGSGDGGGSSSDYNSYDERLTRCYFSLERPGYDFAGGGSRDNAAMTTCLGRVES